MLELQRKMSALEQKQGRKRVQPPSGEESAPPPKKVRGSLFGSRVAALASARVPKRPERDMTPTEELQPQDLPNASSAIQDLPNASTIPQDLPNASTIPQDRGEASLRLAFPHVASSPSVKDMPPDTASEAGSHRREPSGGS